MSILLWPETGNGTSTPLAVKTNKNKACGAAWKEGLYNKSFKVYCRFLVNDINFLLNKRMCLDISSTGPVDARSLKSHSKPPKK